MTHRLPTLLCSGLLLLALAACYDNEPQIIAPAPRPGSAVVTTDRDDANIRTRVMAYGEDGRLNLGSLWPESLTQGMYHAFAWNVGTRYLTVEHGTATILRQTGGLLPSVGELWTAYADFEVQAGQETPVALTLQPQTRLLTLALRVDAGQAERVRRLTATLSGVRRTRVVDPVQAAVITEASTRADSDTEGGTVRLDFTLNADGTAFTASARLLGLVPGAEHILRLSLTDWDGHTGSRDFDLTEDLAGFDTEDGTSLPPDGFQLEAGIDIPEPEPTPDPDPEPEPTPDPEPEPEPTPVPPLFSIDGWTPTDDAEGGADMDVDK